MAQSDNQGTLKSVEIICPLYNAGKYINDLHNSFLRQERVNLQRIHYILTESTDATEDILVKRNATYDKITKNEFSHSLIREKAALESKADVIVFVTQDVRIDKRDWLYNLIKDIDIENERVVASYSRQLPRYDNIEKYAREKNYPAKSSVVTVKDIPRLGLKTFFFSDTSSAVSRKVFKKLGGYDGKNLPTNEDMYFAYKLITNGYAIKYSADSEVIHSHDFTLRELYNRYKLAGKFFKENPVLKRYGVNDSGMSLAVYILKRIIEERKYKLLARYPLDMGARYIGMKVGAR